MHKNIECYSLFAYTYEHQLHLTTTVLTLPHTNKRLEVIYALSIIWLGHEIYTWGSYNIAKVMH